MSELRNGPPDAVSPTGATLTTPDRVLRSAIKAVPAVKWAVGVAGVISAIALVKGLFVNTAAALLAGFGTLVLMVLLVLFAVAARAKSGLLTVPAMVLTWALLVLVIGSSALTVLSAFFQWPRPLPDLVGMTTTPPARSVASVRGLRLPSGGQLLQSGARTLAEYRQPVRFVWDGLPPRAEAWVVVYAVARRLYFPQACIKSPDHSGEMPCTLEIGGQSDIGERFEIAVVVADDAAQRELSEYLSRVDRSGLAELPTGTEIAYTIAVVRQ